MRSRLNLPIVVSYMVICLGILGYLISQLGVVYPWQHPYSLTVNFSDASGILANNDVYMNGAKVGHVDQVSTANGAASVKIVIDNSAGLPIYKDASAEVRKKNLLGETYIDLQRGKNSCVNCDMQAGSTIAIDHTVPITEIDQVLAVFDPTTQQRVQLLLDALGQGTTNRGGDLNSQADSANQLVTALNGPAVELSVRRQQLNDIVQELQKFYDTLANQRQQVKGEFITWNQVMAELANQEQGIGSTVQQANTLMSNLNTLLTGEGANLEAALQGLPSALTSTNQFLQQSNAILNAVLPYRNAIHNVFPNLGTSFADTTSGGQHFWSVYNVGCFTGCGGGGAQTSGYSSSGTSAPDATWMTSQGGA